MFKVTIDGVVHAAETVRVEVPEAFVIVKSDEPLMCLHEPANPEHDDWYYGPQDDESVAWYPCFDAAERDRESFNLIEDTEVVRTSVLLFSREHKPKLGWYVYVDDRTGDTWPVNVTDWCHDTEHGWMASDKEGVVAYFEHDLKEFKRGVTI